MKTDVPTPMQGLLSRPINGRHSLLEFLRWSAYLPIIPEEEFRNNIGSKDVLSDYKIMTRKLNDQGWRDSLKVLLFRGSELGS